MSQTCSGSSDLHEGGPFCSPETYSAISKLCDVIATQLVCHLSVRCIYMDR